MMNYLISAYSVNPYKGSEDSIGWNWVLQYEKNYKEGDRIILLTKKFNEKDTRKGLKEFNIRHVELVIVDVPDALNWFREKHSAFHHMYYILWQHWAWLWVKHSGIHFDVIHHVTMNDYRIPSEMYKAKGAKVIWGPMGGAQVTPKSLKVYEKNQLVANFREFVNKSCSWNPFYRNAIKQYKAIYGDGADRESIEKKIENSAVANHINLLGNRPLNQISEAYKAADIFVLPSLRETSGNVLLEAMAYAVPIVAFDTSFSSMLKEHDCGIFIDTNQNIEAIKQDFCCALTRLIKDAGLRERLGLNGKNFANANLTWEQKFKHIYMRDETK